MIEQAFQKSQEAKNRFFLKVTASFYVLCLFQVSPLRPNTAFKKDISISFLASLPNILLKAISLFTSTNLIVLFYHNL
ncbi:membrane protein [Candidatus Magnetobacterium bavaricum]|uniref:Membrane protein n=1 Tax=Candidatus Magnetobacterium bavaricum TaxID=29290 RepID=A0A0F3GRD9_9BACT|nr:membrane protein [Candidatus Magnetobacterium bavaricum]KJU84327.1 membrane protein [Candidatus Magnetobacterium bavaricum]